MDRTALVHSCYARVQPSSSVGLGTDHALSTLPIRDQLFLDKGEHAFFVSHDNVHFAITIEVTSGDLTTDAGVVVDLIGNEFCGSVLMAGGAEPVKYGGLVCSGVTTVMSVKTLAGNDVLDAITITVVWVIFMLPSPSQVTPSPPL